MTTGIATAVKSINPSCKVMVFFQPSYWTFSRDPVGIIISKCDYDC